jgi:hypothetical protein
MKQKKKPAINRIQARELDKKFVNATKALSKYMHNTGPVGGDLLGYKIPAGRFTDKLGREWEVQAHAVCAKKLMMKKNEVVPMIRKWAIGLKLRVFAKIIMDKVFENK